MHNKVDGMLGCHTSPPNSPSDKLVAWQRTSPGNQPGKFSSKTPWWMLMTTSVIDDWPMSYGFPDGLLIRTPNLRRKVLEKCKSLHPFQKIKRFSQTWKTQPFFNDDASHHSLPPDICLELSTHSRGRNMRPLSVITRL